MPSLGYTPKAMLMSTLKIKVGLNDLRTVTRYGKSTLPEPHPTANVPLSHPLSGHEFIPLQAQSK